MSQFIYEFIAKREIERRLKTSKDTQRNELSLS